jgi:hypothetical protein
MKKVIILVLLLAPLIILEYCGNKTKPVENSNHTSIDTSVVPFKPVLLPDPGITGFHFPEEESVIDGWIKNNDQQNIYKHAWGIWTALTMNSGEKYNGQNLRVFETWYTTDEIANAIEAKLENKALKISKRGRNVLKDPGQFVHARKRKLKLRSDIPAADSSRVLGFVKYDPTAAGFTIKNTLYDSLTLQNMINSGKTDIPDFPNTAITIKPVFDVITKQELDANQGYFQFKVWSGPPAQPIGYPDNLWPGCVYVDINNNGKGNGSIDIGCKHRTPENTYNLSDFISFKLDAENIESIKNNMQGFKAVNEGDVAILVAMHVTSREIKRWTWQTYWWAPDAENPPAPSSKAIADSRPPQLKDGARHYAMAPAYTFILPDQPFTGGNNIGTSIYAYNPYLEAGFDESVFSPPAATVITNGKSIINNVGVRTNCMSCHAHANFNPGNIMPNAPEYIGDTYIDMNDPKFKGTIKVDFLWSIPNNIIENTFDK